MDHYPAQARAGKLRMQIAARTIGLGRYSTLLNHARQQISDVVFSQPELALVSFRFRVGGDKRSAQKCLPPHQQIASWPLCEGSTRKHPLAALKCHARKVNLIC